jgi:hypothetical protein
MTRHAACSCGQLHLTIEECHRLQRRSADWLSVEQHGTVQMPVDLSFLEFRWRAASYWQRHTDLACLVAAPRRRQRASRRRQL